MKRKLSLLLSTVLAITAVFAGNASLVKAASPDDTVSFSLTATLSSEILSDSNVTNFNLAWNWLDASDNQSAGNAINFDKSNTTPAAVNSTIPSDAAKVKFQLQTAGKELEAATIAGVTLNSSQLSELAGSGYVIPISDLGSSNTIAVSINNPAGPAGPAGPGDPPASQPDFEYTIVVGETESSGQIFTGVKSGDILTLPNNYDLSNLAFWITKATDKGQTPNVDYTISNMGNTSTVRDSEDRNPLEVRTIASGSTYVTLGLEYHAGSAGVPASYNTGVPGLTINQITFAKGQFEGVAVDTGIKPDMYDDTVYSDVVDIASGTESNPARTAVYYGSSTIDLSTVNGAKSIASIAPGAGLNAGAITVTGSTVKINSPFYASIPLKVTLNDGTVGYLTLDRIGIEIRDYAKDAVTLHGSQSGCSLSGVTGTGNRNIVATFYYGSTESYTNYNVVAKLTFADGSEQTVVVGGFGETGCIEPTLKGGDFLVWSGDQADRPVKVSVTAVKNGATSGDSFGGACFGAGNGVTQTFN